VRPHRLAGFTSAVLAIALLTAAAPGDRELLDAVKRGDVAGVQAQLRAGADPNAAQGDGLTALHIAAQTGNLEITRTLLGARANVSAKTRLGDYTPLHLAAGGGHTTVVRALMDAGADVNAVTAYTGVTPLHLAAKAVGGETVVKTLIERGAAVNVREAAAGQTPLMFAAAAGRAASVRELLRGGADAKLQTEVMDVIKQLVVDRKANEKLQETRQEIRKSAEGGTGRALTVTEEQQAIAAQREFLRNEREVAQALEGFQPEQLYGKGTYYRGGPEFVSMPLETLVGKTGGMSALHHAARAGHVEAVENLLDGSADINVRSGDGSTPLVLALLNGQFDLAMELIERGADVNIVTENDGVGPLFATLQTQWALRFTAQPQPRAHDNAKATHLEVLKALLDKGANPNVALTRHLWLWEWEGKMGLDITGATPFWRAAFAQDVEAMKLLAAHGADANQASVFGEIGLRTRRQPDGRQQEDSGLPLIPAGTKNMWPIHVAAGGGYLGLGAFQQNNMPNSFLMAVKYLVEEHGADVNVKDAWGYTPLHYAAVHGENELVEYLVAKGADVTVASRLGQSPVDLARGGQGGFFLRTPYPKTVELLQKLGSPFLCLETHFRDTGDWCAGAGVGPFEEETVEDRLDFQRQRGQQQAQPTQSPATPAKPATPTPPRPR
jgi:ankyrin repeat protein